MVPKLSTSSMEKVYPPAEIRPMLEDIKFLSANNSYEFRYMNIIYNRVANRLAVSPRAKMELNVWTKNWPTELGRLLFCDVAG